MEWKRKEKRSRSLLMSEKSRKVSYPTLENGNICLNKLIFKDQEITFISEKTVFCVYISLSFMA